MLPVVDSTQTVLPTHFLHTVAIALALFDSAIGLAALWNSREGSWLRDLYSTGTSFRFVTLFVFVFYFSVEAILDGTIVLSIPFKCWIKVC